MTRRPKRFARLLLAVAPLTVALACTPAFFGQREIERDMARTAMHIERIYQLNAETQNLVNAQLKALETKRKTDSELTLRSLAEMEQRVEDLQETLGIVRSQVEEIRYRTVGESPDRVPIQVGEGDRASTVVLEGNQFLLDGQRALARQDYAAARAAFQEFLEQFPNSRRAVDAQMWIAETLYRENKWTEARAAYLVVEQRYLASRRVPEALMKMALCETELGQEDQAVTTLERLIAKYPKCDQIERANEMLRSFIKVEPQVPPRPSP